MNAMWPLQTWVIRGLGVAGIHVLARVVLGVAIVQWPREGYFLRWIAVALVVLAVMIWGGVDGIRDRREHPDPADGADLTMLWLKAAACGAPLAGALTWLVGRITDVAVGQDSVFFEITVGAAFTMLLVFVPVVVAVAVGGRLAGRAAEDGPADDERDEAAG